jgi:hypothetical protein
MAQRGFIEEMLGDILEMVLRWVFDFEKPDRLDVLVQKRLERDEVERRYRMVVAERQSKEKKEDEELMKLLDERRKVSERSSREHFIRERDRHHMESGALAGSW